MKVQHIKVGAPVTYWGVIKENGEKYDPLETVITSDAWQLGHGEIVCKVEGVSGGVLISHLEAR